MAGPIFPANVGANAAHPFSSLSYRRSCCCVIDPALNGHARRTETLRYWVGQHAGHPPLSFRVPTRRDDEESWVGVTYNHNARP